RQERGRRADGGAHLRPVLADAHAPDRVAGEVVRERGLRGLAPQVLEHAALHDAEERLAARVAAELAMARNAALEPRARAPRRGLDARAIRGHRRAVVEGHD